MTQARPTLPNVILNTVVIPAIAYYAFWQLASRALDSTGLLAGTSLGGTIRQMAEPIAMAGPVFEPLRAILFGIVFYRLGEPFFGRKPGWLLMCVTLATLGILSTLGPATAPDGIIVASFPLGVDLAALPRALAQGLLLSSLLFYCVNHPDRRWVAQALRAAFFLLMGFPVLGLAGTGSRG